MCALACALKGPFGFDLPRGFLVAPDLLQCSTPLFCAPPNLSLWTLGCRRDQEDKDLLEEKREGKKAK